MREARLRNEAQTRKEEQNAENDAQELRDKLLLETLMKKLNEIDDRSARMEAAAQPDKIAAPRPELKSSDEEVNKSAT